MKKAFIILAVILLSGMQNVIAMENSADQSGSVETKKADQSEIKLPEKGSNEYWVVRCQAMSELIPMLTKKRTQLKRDIKVLGDYLLAIDKANDFASSDIEVGYDPELYSKLLQIDQQIKDLGIKLPKERPTWDQIVEVAMLHSLDEGYWPTDIEDDEDLQQYIKLCKTKEEYGQKVRKDIRKILDKGVKMWVYLEQIDMLGDFKVHMADLALQASAEKAAKRNQITEIGQRDALARQRAREAQDFDDQMSRRSFYSSTRERNFDARQDRLQYRQSRLDERYTRSNVYFY